MFVPIIMLRRLVKEIINNPTNWELISIDYFKEKTRINNIVIGSGIY